MLRYLYRTVIVVAVMSLFMLPVQLQGQSDAPNDDGKIVEMDISPKASHSFNWFEDTTPVLTVLSKEVDLGDIAPGDVVNRLLTLRNAGDGILQWSTRGPEDWALTGDQELTGETTTETEYIHISIRALESKLAKIVDMFGLEYQSIQLALETEGKIIQFRKYLPMGEYHKSFNIESTGGNITIPLNFKIVAADSKPWLHMEPPQIDFGAVTPGKQVSKQIIITNKGRETVQWQVTVPHRRSGRVDPLYLQGRYVSFMSDEMKRGEPYTPPGHLGEFLNIQGNWQKLDGYPTVRGENNILQYLFSGTGIVVHLRHGPDMGTLSMYVDDRLIYVYDGAWWERGREELPLVEDLPDGRHVLTLVTGDDWVTIEGVTVYGNELRQTDPGWMTMIPDSGTTTRERDYVTVRLDTRFMNPGFYSGPIVVNSDRGNILVGTSVEVGALKAPALVDVYRYVKDQSYMYITNPRNELNKPESRGYRKEGIAFRLLPSGAPGTTEFYHWYSSSKEDNYYSYDLYGGGKPLKGYVFEDSIGNIATSKLNGTRELYRWYNPKMGRHFYTTDQNGEGMGKKGYIFDGIAGYVR